MKCITREVKMYDYTFANIDLTDGHAYNITKKTLSSPMGQRAIKAFCESHDGAVFIRKEVRPEKFALPLDIYIEQCRAYAALVAEGKAEPITEEDEEESEDINE